MLTSEIYTTIVATFWENIVLRDSTFKDQVLKVIANNARSHSTVRTHPLDVS